MERIVRILNQSGLQTRQYMDRKTGDQKVINSVVLKLTDGTDTFLGEITGERAQHDVVILDTNYHELNMNFT